MKQGIWIGAGVFVLAVAVLIWLFVVNTVRIPQRGDRFVYQDAKGLPYVFTVTQSDPASHSLEMKGEGDGDFYNLVLRFSYDGRWLEWTHLEAKGRGENLTCDLNRGDRGFLLFPIKRLFSRPKEFGFRAVCTEEGAYTFQVKLAFGGREQIDSKAGSFRANKISHVVSFPLQQDTLGTLDLSVVPKVGFPAHFTVTINEEGGPGAGAARGYTFDLVQFLPSTP